MRGQRRCPRLDYSEVLLDDIEELRSGASGVYADRLLVGEGWVAVVEEAKRPKRHDLDQLAETIEALRRGGLREALRSRGVSPSEAWRVVGVIHYEKGVDTVVHRMRIEYERRLRTPIYMVGCRKGLLEVLEKRLCSREELRLG